MNLRLAIRKKLARRRMAVASTQRVNDTLRPPVNQQFLVTSDGVYWKDDDGAYLIEAV